MGVSLFLTVVVVLGVIVVGASFVCGKYIETQFIKYVDLADEKIIFYDRGIFQSKIILRMKILVMNKSFVTKLAVTHGPIIFNGANKFGLGSIVHEIDVTELSDEEGAAYA